MRVLPLLLFATVTLAQDVSVPPVPIGIKRSAIPRQVKSPIAFPDERVPWMRIRSAHYDVLSNASEEQTREIVSDLETLASILTRTSKRFSTAAVPTTVLIFANRKESNPYFELLLRQDNPPVTGLYVRHGGGGTMFIDASHGKSPIEKTAMHELVHDLLRQGERPAPQWIEEGLAEYIGNAEIREGKIIAGKPIPAHLRTLRQQGVHIPLEEMFRVEAETSISMIAQFYAQSWAAVDWLMDMDHVRFFAFLEDVERGKPVADALATHYGKTLLDMEKPIHGANRKGHSVELAGSVAEIPAPAPLDRATLLFELGRFLSRIAGAEADTQRHYAEALRIDAKHARALAAAGRFEEALAAGQNDPDVHLMYAEAILARPLGPLAGRFETRDGDVERFRKARALAEHALALGAHEGSARAAIGTTHLVESDLAPGIEQLERAYALLPRRKDVALNLYAMLLRTQQREKAALYERVFANTQDEQLVFAVKNIRRTAETSRAGELAKAGKLDEAAAIIRDLAAATDDPIGRRELEQYVASLESIAVVNRHITMYNDAIALANKGQNRAALKMLAELLTIAKDERVVRDATKLQATLRER